MSIKEFAKQKNESIRAVIHEAEEGGYWATIPAFPGCVTEGETIEETKSNLLEAAEVWLCTKRQTVVPHHGNRVLKQGTLQEIFRQAGIPKPR